MGIMFHVFFSLPCLFVLARFLWPLPWRRASKVLIAVPLVIASQFHLWNLLSSGSVFSPEYPRALVIAMNWGFSAILLLALLQVAADLVALAVAVATRRRRRIPARLRYAMAMAAMLLAGVGVHQAIRVPPVKEVEIAVRGLPPEFDGYRVVHLTDMHISRLFDARWARGTVAQVNALKPDAVLITGDSIDGTLAARSADVAPLAGLRAVDGVFMCPGNHEYFFGAGEWMRHFAALGITVLANDHAVIERGAGRLAVVGLTDPTAPQSGMPGPSLDRALRGIPAQVPVLMLDHHPAAAREAAAAGVALQLSGHTHGGLIPVIDRVFALANGGYVSGLYRVEAPSRHDAMPLYVGNGTAIWPGLALRLGRPSELTRVTLRRAGE